jgi:hypothetical protein
MRTTRANDDVLTHAEELAINEPTSAGQAISALVSHALHLADTSHKTRNGIPLLKINPDSPRINPELVHRLHEELL